MELDIANLLFIVLNVHSYNRDLEHMRYHCLIVAHGYSTASSMADTVNKILGSHILMVSTCHWIHLFRISCYI